MSIPSERCILVVQEWSLKKWKLGSNSYWKMAGAMGFLISNESIHGRYGPVDILGYYNKLHAKRMELVGSVLDLWYSSPFG